MGQVNIDSVEAGKMSRLLIMIWLMLLLFGLGLTWEVFRFGIEKDGNCAFRAASHQIYRTQDHHEVLREMAAQHINGRLDFYGHHFSADGYEPNRLHRNGVYAGEEALVALSHLYNMIFYIEVPTGFFSLYHPEFSEEERSRLQPAQLKFIPDGGGHYDSVVTRETNGESVSNNDHTYRQSEKLNATRGNNEDLKGVKRQNNPQNTQRISPESHADRRSEAVRGMSSLLSGVHQDSSSSVTLIVSESEVIINDGVVTDAMDHDGYVIKDLTQQTTTKTQSEDYKCKVCNKQYKWRKSLNRHEKLHLTNHVFKETITCPQIDCSFTSLTLAEMNQHYTSQHGLQIEEEHLSFQNMDEFKLFKDSVEEENFCQFYKSGGSRSKHHAQIYYCSRRSTRKATSEPPSKVQKTKKIGECPASMYVKENMDATITVKFVKTHFHEIGQSALQHMRVPDSLKCEILNKVDKGVAMEKIIDDTRQMLTRTERTEENLKKLTFRNMISRQAINRIKKYYNNTFLHNHPSDGESVDMKIAQMIKEEYNPVLAYKPQFEESTLPGIDKENFIFIFQSEAQMKMYKENCGKIVSIDSTHRTVQYNFKLITLLVIDEYYRGYPVAFCLSGTEDISVIKLFFQAVDDAAGNPTVNVIITDDDNTGYRAAVDVFGTQIRHILCQWHVFRAFSRRCLPQLNKDDRERVRDTLYNLMYEKDLQKYEDSKWSFIDKWQYQYPQMVKYMKDNYFNREEKWTLSHRQHFEYGRVDTNNFIESFHNKLKTQKFKQKQNKRMDVLIETLEQIEAEYYLNLFTRKTLNKDQASKDMITRHENSKNIDTKYVSKITDDVFHVQSGTSIYEITRVKASCQCKVTCPDCKVCMHMYRCTCGDRAAKDMCKHVHKVHSVYHRAVDDNMQNRTHIEINHMAPSTSSGTQSNQGKNKLDLLKRTYEELGNLINKVDTTAPINENFQDMISHTTRQLNAMKCNWKSFNRSRPVSKLVTKLKMRANQRNIRQRLHYFRRINNRPGRKSNKEKKKSQKDDK